MRKQGGVNALLTKIQALQQQNLQLRKQIKQRQNFNRQLCSENRKRRLKNKELMSLENQRLLQLQNIKGYQEEYKKMAVNLKKALSDSEEKLEEYQDEILILKTQVTKIKRQTQKYEDENKSLKRQIQKKTEEFQRFMVLQNEISKKRLQTRKPMDEQEQIFQLVCQNQEWEMKVKESQKQISNLRMQLEQAKSSMSALRAEVENNEQIIKILRIQFQEQMKQALRKSPNKTASNTHQSLIHVSTNMPISKAPQGQYGARLKIKQKQYFSSLDHLLHTQNRLQNMSFNPITIYFCQPINLQKDQTCFVRIRLAGQGEINLGLSNNCFSSVEAVAIRNYIYYSNCSGLIVIDKQGKIIDEYASINDILTLSITTARRSARMKLFRNDKSIYQCSMPEQLLKGQCLYAYVKLFQFMSVEIQ